MTAVAPAQRPSFGPVAAGRTTQRDDLRPLLIAVPVVTGILAGMALGLNALALVASVVGLGIAVLSPVTGLAILAFMAPLKPPAVIPAPGFDLALVAAICLGCVYRLPLDRPATRISAPVLAPQRVHAVRLRAADPRDAHRLGSGARS
jgi:hypothetical protein